MIASLHDERTIALHDSFRQQQGCTVLEGARFSPMHRAWLVDATPANVAAIATMCVLPPELEALMPAVRAAEPIADTGEWLTYDASLYDPALSRVWNDAIGDYEDRNRPLAKEPWQHQRDAVAAAMATMGDGGGFAFLMEQRTGKTRCALEVVSRVQRRHGIRRVLVIAPRIPCSEWAVQAAEFLGAIDHEVMLLSSGSAKKRRDTLAALGDHELSIAVVNYDSAWRIRELLGWADFAIADEFQKLKGHSSRRSKGVAEIGKRTRFRLGLSGTPITSGPLDAFGEFRFTNPEMLGPSYFAFRARTAIMQTNYGANGSYKQVVGYNPQGVAELTEKIHRVSFRVTMEECAGVPNVEHVKVDVPLEGEAARVYRELERESVVEWESGETSVDIVLTKMLRLQQITCGFVPRDDGEMVWFGSGKTEATVDLCESVLGSGQVVIVCRFIDELERIVEGVSKIKDAEGAHIGVEVLRGGLSDTESLARRTRFQEGESRVIVAQIATGEGIPLHSGNTMIFASTDFDLEHYLQMYSRIDAKEKTTKRRYYFMCCPGTIDETIIESRINKRQIASLIVDRNPFRRGGVV